MTMSFFLKLTLKSALAGLIYFFKVKIQGVSRNFKEKISLISRSFLLAVLSFHVVFHIYFYIFTKNGWPISNEVIDDKKLHTKQ